MRTNHERRLPDVTMITPSILYFGTPVALVTSLNEDGRANIGPISSAWALGWTLILGLEATAKTTSNLRRHPECVVNLASENLVKTVEELAPLTGNDPVPQHKADRFRTEADKFAAVGLTPVDSEVVAVPRIGECPIQLEAAVRNFFPIGEQDERRLGKGAFAIEVQVLRVHADKELVVKDRYINPAAWRPLIYNFRHYYGLGASLGKTFRAEY